MEDTLQTPAGDTAPAKKTRKTRASTAKKPRAAKPRAKRAKKADEKVVETPMQTTTEAVAAPAAPKHEPATLDQLRKKGLAMTNEAVRKPYLEAINYIELLGNTTGTNIHSWDMQGCFGTPDGLIMTDHGEINKKFFILKEDEDRPDIEQVLNDKIMHMLAEVDRNYGAARAAEMKKQHERSMQQIKQYEQAIAQLTKEAYKQYVASEAQPPLVSAQIRELIKDNFWEIEKIVNGKLYCVSKGDIVVQVPRTGGKEFDNLNLGQMLAVLDLGNMHMTVWGHKNNRYIGGGQIHPHIFAQGSICWGSAGGLATKYMSTGQIAPLFKLIAAVLCNYNQSGGYNENARLLMQAKVEPTPPGKNQIPA